MYVSTALLVAAVAIVEVQGSDAPDGIPVVEIDPADPLYERDTRRRHRVSFKPPALTRTSSLEDSSEATSSHSSPMTPPYCRKCGSPASDVSTMCGSGSIRRGGAEEDRTLLEQAGALLESYRKHPSTVNCHGRHPSKAAVARITEDLLRLVFPGFFQELTPYAEAEFEMSVALLFNSVRHRLEEEISKCTTAPISAAEIASGLLAGLPEIREKLMLDIEAARKGDPAAESDEEIIIAYPCIETITVYRIANLLHSEWKVKVLPRIMSEWAHSRTGVDIHPAATIGTHFFIDHGTGTVIGGTARVGNNVRLYHGVTLGAKSLSVSNMDKIKQDAGKGVQRHPTIEDNVTIYLHATIVGGKVVIGEGSTISCCTYIDKDIPAHTMILPNHFPDVTISYKKGNEAKGIPKHHRECIGMDKM